MMRLRPLTATVALLLATIGSTAAAAPEGQPAAERPAGGPIVTATRQNAFTIPFRIEPAQTPSQQPVDVQLHVSTNQGTTWQQAGQVKPEKGAFVFRAPHDGEYWYSIRTVDKQGTARPEGLLQPQLKVTVDTVAPRLELSASRGPAGELLAHWQAVDPNLKPESFKLDYQVGSTGTWERVAVESAPPAMRHTLTGDATWWPAAGGGVITVRAEVMDTAGNPAVSQALIKPSDTPPQGDVARGATSDSWRPNQTQTDPTRWPADRATSDPLAHAANPEQRGPDASRATGQRVPAQPIGQSYRAARSGSVLDFNLVPAGERARMVNSRSFELEYEIDSVGPSGIAKVELWGTRDGGRTWSSFGVDSDNRSPMPVNVDADGVYGFRVVVQSGSGFGGRQPAEGDTPDIWIGVDLTKPTGRIISALVAADGSELVISWEASDDVLDPRPITLSFGSSAQGPWTPIASGLENTGNYHWRLDSRVPDRIYLRLEVRDEAGNLGVFDAAEPVSLDRHRPEGRIRGVRPLGQPERN